MLRIPNMRSRRSRIYTYISIILFQSPKCQASSRFYFEGLKFHFEAGWSISKVWNSFRGGLYDISKVWNSLEADYGISKVWNSETDQSKNSLEADYCPEEVQNSKWTKIDPIS
ncbi:hypothetical protein RclHR1_02400015 [Rhizophagus clarus]|uniref:Uncharacterized protein n=1 Tax=Rhizophagus clarus TaxID=94130 RepID=A0A2Z6RAJ0_9GLOM|nr:hypothetical protein RclHR1_02400015 [Rhizophagus clarus]